jgi:hypothetical protein
MVDILWKYGESPRERGGSNPNFLVENFVTPKIEGAVGAGLAKIFGRQLKCPNQNPPSPQITSREGKLLMSTNTQISLNYFRIVE